MAPQLIMTPDVIYGIEDRPPLGRAIVLALQHVLTMFGSTVAVPLLLGPAMGMNRGQIALLISSVMLCSGIATLIQSTYGARLPIIQGVSFSFLAAFFGIISTVTAPSPDGFGADGPVAMQYIAGSVLVGASLEIVVGFSGLMGWIRRVLSPVVVGPVIMLIGLALYKAGAGSGRQLADFNPHDGAHHPVFTRALSPIEAVSHVPPVAGDSHGVRSLRALLAGWRFSR